MPHIAWDHALPRTSRSAGRDRRITCSVSLRGTFAPRLRRRRDHSRVFGIPSHRFDLYESCRGMRSLHRATRAPLFSCFRYRSALFLRVSGPLVYGLCIRYHNTAHLLGATRVRLHTRFCGTVHSTAIVPPIIHLSIARNCYIKHFVPFCLVSFHFAR